MELAEHETNGGMIATRLGIALAVLVMAIPAEATAAPTPTAPTDEPVLSPAAPRDPSAVSTVAVSEALSLDPGATCLEHDRLSEQVVTWLGRDALDERLTVVVEGDPIEVRSLRFTLQTDGEVIAEREFVPGPSRCDDLHGVVALAIALAVDATVLESVGIASPVEPPPLRDVDVSSPTAEGEEPDPSHDRTVHAMPTPGPDLERTPRSWSLRATARGLLTYGLPTVGGGGELGLELGWRRGLDIELGGLAISSPPQTLDDVVLKMGLVAARVGLCAGPQLQRVRPRMCARAIAGAGIGRTEGLLHNFLAIVPWAAMAIGADIRVRLAPRVDLSFGLDGIVTALRPVFDVREPLGIRRLHALPRFGAAFGAGVVVRLW